jgi:hypothetical protein
MLGIPLARLVILAVLVLSPALLAQSVLAQQAGPLGTKDGDTVVVILHQVPAAKQAQYEQWMQGVWWPAAQKTGSKYSDYRRAYSERRRYVPTGKSEDGTLTFVFVYPYTPRSGPEVKRGGVGATLETSGMTEAEIERNMKTFQALGVKTQSLILVQQEYR